MVPLKFLIRVALLATFKLGLDVKVITFLKERANLFICLKDRSVTRLKVLVIRVVVCRLRVDVRDVVCRPINLIRVVIQSLLLQVLLRQVFALLIKLLWLWLV